MKNSTKFTIGLFLLMCLGVYLFAEFYPREFHENVSQPVSEAVGTAQEAILPGESL